MAEWKTLKDILQDLSVAQGFTVPAASLETFGDKAPPPLSIEDEETEEQEYDATEGGDLHLGPDIGLIQQMLSEVRNKKDENKDDQSDLDPFCPEFLPKSEKAKLSRNVAISSIKAAKEAKIAARRPVPKDIISVMFKRKSQTNTEARSESVSPLQTSPSPGAQSQYSPSKLSNKYYNKYMERSQLKEDFEEDIWSRTEHIINQNEARKEREAEVVRPQELVPDTNKQTGNNQANKRYTPSQQAQETYEKYLKKSKLNESLGVDIWTLAERKMKEIEAKKEREAEVAGAQGLVLDKNTDNKQTKKQYTPSQSAQDTYKKTLKKSKFKESLADDIWTLAERKMKEIEAKKKRRSEATAQEFGFDQVNLSEHRHQSAEDCVVCEVASKHGYVFEEDPKTTL